MLSQTCRDRTPYRMLTHSHSATSLYNLSQSAITLHRIRHLTCERAWFGLVLFSGVYIVFAILDFWHLNILILSRIGCLVFSLFYLQNYSEVIYQHGNLSSSGMYLLFTYNLNTKFVQMPHAHIFLFI
jgi:hypothetical protein